MNRFKKEFLEHEKEMSKLNKWERFVIRLIPFIIAGLVIYILCL